MVNVENRVKQLRLNHAHKIYNKKCPSYMKEKFVPISEKHMYNSRFSIGNFHVPCDDSYIKKTIYYNAIKDWNSLPINIKKHRKQKHV